MQRMIGCLDKMSSSALKSKTLSERHGQKHMKAIRMDEILAGMERFTVVQGSRAVCQMTLKHWRQAMAHSVVNTKASHSILIF